MARISDSNTAKAVRTWLLSLNDETRKPLMAKGGAAILAAYEASQEAAKPVNTDHPRLVPETFGILQGTEVVQQVTLYKFAAPRTKDPILKAQRGIARRMHAAKYKAGLVDLLLSASFMEPAGSVISLRTIDGDRLEDFVASTDSDDDSSDDGEEVSAAEVAAVLDES